MAGHSRRYTLSRLRRVLETAGYGIEFATYFFGFLPGAILVARVLPYRLGFARREASEKTARSDHELGHPLARRIFHALTR